MTRPLSDHKLYLQVDHATYTRLKEYARASGKSMTVVGAMCLAAYLQSRAELGEQIPEIGKPEPAPIIHDLLAGVEGRLAQTMDTQSHHLLGLVQGIRRLEIMLEKGMLSYLQHTPEVPVEQKGQAAASGQARFDRWRASVSIAEKKAREGKE